MQERKLLASFGRRQGRKPRSGKQALLDVVLPKLSITLPEAGFLDMKSVFPHLETWWLEIGFGSGEHLVHQATLYPDTGIIGCEPYIHGIGNLLKGLEDEGRDNVRIFGDDARLLLEKIPAATFEKIFILYPDPWPKTRHHKRRLISHETLSELARVMKPGAELRLATDHEDYMEWMLEHLLASPDFSWQAKRAVDWKNPPSDWIPTRYEQKRLAGVPTYLRFTRC